MGVIFFTRFYKLLICYDISVILSMTLCNKYALVSHLNGCTRVLNYSEGKTSYSNISLIFFLKLAVNFSWHLYFPTPLVGTSNSRAILL